MILTDKLARLDACQLKSESDFLFLMRDTESESDIIWLRTLTIWKQKLISYEEQCYDASESKKTFD